MDKDIALVFFHPQHFYQRQQMINVGVNAGIGRQAEKVHRRSFYHFVPNRYFEKLAALNCQADAGVVLIDDGSRSDVGVSDFGTAYFAPRNSDGNAGRLKFRAQIIFADFFEISFFGKIKGVALGFVRDADAVHNR